MSENQKQGKPIIWGILGFLIGGFLVRQLLEFIGTAEDRWSALAAFGLAGGVLGGLAIGTAAFLESKKNNGAPPAWLWRSKKNRTP